MFGTRKLKARIADLEAQLADARENLVVARIEVGSVIQRATVRKGQWYTTRFLFRALDDGAELRDVFVGTFPPEGGGSYLDSSVAADEDDRFRGGVVM